MNEVRGLSVKIEPGPDGNPYTGPIHVSIVGIGVRTFRDFGELIRAFGDAILWARRIPETLLPDALKLKNQRDRDVRVPVVEFKRPNGVQSRGEVLLKDADDARSKLEQMQAAGVQFGYEQIKPDEVAVYAFNEDEDLDIAIVPDVASVAGVLLFWLTGRRG